jgi:hypothetical protein
MRIWRKSAARNHDSRLIAARFLTSDSVRRGDVTAIECNCYSLSVNSRNENGRFGGSAARRIAMGRNRILHRIRALH